MDIVTRDSFDKDATDEDLIDHLLWRLNLELAAKERKQRILTKVTNELRESEKLRIKMVNKYKEDFKDKIDGIDNLIEDAKQFRRNLTSVYDKNALSAY